MLTVIVLAPLVGALILGLFGKRMGERAISLIACSTVAVSMTVALYAFFARLLPLPEHQRTISEYLLTWINVGSLRADISFLLDPLSGVYVLFVTFVGFWIHIFATGYMRGDSGYWRFFAYMNLFMFAMLTLVLADNFLMMFVGWEGVGLCSYLLIGYYFLRNYANDAAKKAFIVNRIGDFGFAIGVMLLFLKSGSIFYFDDPSRGIHGVFNWAMSQAADSAAVSAIFAGGITTIAVLLFIGATGKSAQIPLYVWLPDAMAGPTPVSALIHAATMVTAGVYMISRASFIYTKAPMAMMIVAVVGTTTALLAATIGLAQWDIKKVLAYSTISQLGYMFLACGVGAFAAAIFHVFTHAFFKALLFLGAGSIIVALHHEQDMRSMGGLKKYMPVTFFTMLVGWLAISGVPLLSGFFSKDEILFSVFTTSVLSAGWARLLWAIGALTALMTAIYMTRLMVLTFWGENRLRQNQAGAGAIEPATYPHQEPPRESSASMTVPLVVLAVGAALAGYVGVPVGLSGGKLPNYLERLLEPAISRPAQASEFLAESHSVAGHSIEMELTIVSSVIAIVGIAIGWAWFRRRPLWQPPRLLERKYYVDELYDVVIVRPVKVVATDLLWKAIDVGIIDGAVGGIANLAAQIGGLMRHLQSGLARAYVAMIVFGALLIIAYFVVK
jgi:NADH-quinone oxidoreductase subunit L